MLQKRYFVSAIILYLIFFTPALNAQNISMSDMAADHPACLEHDVELGCLLADFPNALVSRVDGEAFESMKEQDLADTVDLAKEVSDGLEAAKFLGLDLPRYGATAAVKMKALATLKALPATLTWEGFKRNTARVDLLLLSEAEMQDAANELGAILGAENSALPQLLEADRYWPIIMFYSPKGSSFVRWLTGRDGERDFPISLAAPDATPTQAQSAQNSSWIAPTLNYPEHWLTEELVELRTEPDTLYFITPKEPLDVAGMMDAQLSVAVEGATRGVKNAYAEYDPEAEPVDLLVEAALAGRRNSTIFSCTTENSKQIDVERDSSRFTYRFTDLKTSNVELELELPMERVSFERYARGYSINFDADGGYLYSVGVYFPRAGRPEGGASGVWVSHNEEQVARVVCDSYPRIDRILEAENEMGSTEAPSISPVKTGPGISRTKQTSIAIRETRRIKNDRFNYQLIDSIKNFETSWEIFEYGGHGEGINGIDIAPNGKSIVTASSDGTSIIREIITGRRIAAFNLGLNTSLQAAKFLPTGRRVFMVTQSGDGYVGQLKNGRIQYKISNVGSIDEIDFTTDGRFAALAIRGALQIRDSGGSRLLHEIPAHSRSINQVRFSPDDQLVLTASSDGTVRLWDVGSGTLRATLDGHDGVVLDAAFSPDGAQVASVSAGGVAAVWDTKDGTLRHSLTDTGGGLSKVEFSGDGQRILIASRFAVSLWHAVSGEFLREVDKVSTLLSVVSFLPGDSVILTGTSGEVRFKRSTTGDILNKVSMSDFGNISAVFSRDGFTFALASAGSKIAKVWRLP